ncbi:hypothetical protein E4T56_gene13379 [Termitomyces sp. T112]|nr:hypothetical protein E4T56_gene13379 [Termitomyces sp. T112]
MHFVALLTLLPTLVQAFPAHYRNHLVSRDNKKITDKDFLLSCPGNAGSPNVKRADRCTLINIKHNPDKVIFQNVGNAQLNCAGGTTPTTVTLGGSTSVSTTTSVDTNIGITFGSGFSIGGGISSSTTKESQTTKQIQYDVPPGRQAILTAGYNFHSQTGNVQVNYGSRVNGHYIWYTGVAITQLVPDGQPPRYEVHESKCGTNPLDLNNKS